MELASISVMFTTAAVWGKKHPKSCGVGEGGGRGGVRQHKFKNQINTKIEEA